MKVRHETHCFSFKDMDGDVLELLMPLCALGALEGTEAEIYKCAPCVLWKICRLHVWPRWKNSLLSTGIVSKCKQELGTQEYLWNAGWKLKGKSNQRGWADNECQDTECLTLKWWCGGGLEPQQQRSCLALWPSMSVRSCPQVSLQDITWIPHLGTALAQVCIPSTLNVYNSLPTQSPF